MKVRKSKYKVDAELQGLKNVKSISQVAEDKESYNDILKDAVITRTAKAGDKFVTQTISYTVNEIEIDWDSTVYKYIYDGEEYFSNFKYNNPVEIIQPKTN